MSSNDQYDRRKFVQCFAGIPAILTAACSGGLSATEFVKNSHGERMIERYPDFEDKRSKKVMFVAHCILNQNARINSCGYTPAAIPKIAGCLIERGIGISQMPCPELGCLGLGRGGAEEIYDQLSTPGARRYLKTLAASVVYQAQQYRKQGFRVLGVLGIDGSPSCGVDLTWYEGEGPGTGAYMEELREALKKANLADIPVKGVQDALPDEAVALIEKLDS